MRDQRPLSNGDFKARVAAWRLDPSLAERKHGHISGWDVSKVTSFASAFKLASDFNADLNRWDTSSVTDMQAAFKGAVSFNSALSRWNTSSVRSMADMFENAVSFDQDLDSWNTALVTSVSDMFKGAHVMNHPITHWDTRRVRSSSHMFQNAQSWNQPLSGWGGLAVGDHGRRGAQRSCECFFLCHARSFADFLARLPRTAGEASPWLSYLRAVYRQDVPPHANVADLELFYLDLLPTSTCGRPRLPACPAHACRGWLDERTVSDSELARQAEGRTHIVRDGLVLSQRPCEKRPTYRAGDWVEVIRHSVKGGRHYPSEGLQRGCWFYPARGSGVFVNVGRVRTLRSREEGYRAFGGGDQLWAAAAGRMGFESVHTAYDNRTQCSAVASSGFLELPHLSLDWVRRHPNAPLSFFVAPPSELMLAVSSCMLREVAGACPPVELRTGVGASAPCHCREGAKTWVNCDSSGGGGAGGARGDRSHRRRDAEPEDASRAQ